MSVENVNNSNNNINNNVMVSQRPATFRTGDVSNNRFAQEISAASERAMVDLDAIFHEAALQYDLPVDFLMAVARAESNFRPHAVSPAGAQGIMQLMPGTARHLGVTDPFDPRQSIFGGARYLRENLNRFDGDLELTLAAYNAGWPTVQRHGGIPPFRETQNYVARIMGWLNEGVEFSAGSVAVPGNIGSPNTFNLSQSSVRAANGLHRGEGIADREAAAAAANPNQTEQRDNGFDMREFTSILAQMLKMKIMNLQMGSSNRDGGFF